LFADNLHFRGSKSLAKPAIDYLACFINTVFGHPNQIMIGVVYNLGQMLEIVRESG
jgi:hypothetical protein